MTEQPVAFVHQADHRVEPACSRRRRHPPIATHPPYTTLFRSEREALIGGPSGAPAIIGRPEVHAKADRRRPARSPGLWAGLAAALRLRLDLACRLTRGR